MEAKIKAIKPTDLMNTGQMIKLDDLWENLEVLVGGGRKEK